MMCIGNRGRGPLPRASRLGAAVEPVAGEVAGEQEDIPLDGDAELDLWPRLADTRLHAGTHALLFRWHFHSLVRSMHLSKLVI